MDADQPTTAALARYELPDFHPKTGHRHHCENPASCDCAAWLYALAQHAEEALWSIRAGTIAGTNLTTSGAAPAASIIGHPSALSTPKADPSGLTASLGNPVPTGWAVVRRDVFDRAYSATP